MVKGNNHLSRHRPKNHKSNLVPLFPPIEVPTSSSGIESREDSDFKFSSHNNTVNTIRGHHESSAPSWDSRAAPSALTNPQHDADTNYFQQSHQNVHPDAVSNQWEEYSVQSGGTHQHLDANANKNIWSSRKESVLNDQSIDSYTSTISLDACSWNNHIGHERHSNHDRNIREMSFSMNRLNLSSTGVKDSKNMAGASVTSGNSYNSSVLPGVVGVSSGSTGGESSLTQGQRYQSNYSYSNQHGQSMMNPGGQPYHPSQYPIQQQQQQQQHQQQQQQHQHNSQQQQQQHPPNQSVDLFRPIRDREAPPGFHLDQSHEMIYTSMNSTPQILEERNLIHPKASKNANDSRRGSARNQGGGRRREKQRDRKHGGRHTGSKREQGSSHHQRSKQSQRHMGTTSVTNEGERGVSSIYRHPRNDEDDYASTHGESSMAGSDAIRMIMNPQGTEPTSSATSLSSSNRSALIANRLPLERLTDDNSRVDSSIASASAVASLRVSDRSILPSMKDIEVGCLHEVGDEEFYGDDNDDEEESYFLGAESSIDGTTISTHSKKRDWLLRMNRRLAEVPVGDLDPSVTPISAIMNAWAKTKSAHGASMVEAWLNRAQEEFEAGNTKVIPTNKMFTMTVDAWAKSGEGVSAAQRAETILQDMNKKYQSTGLENLRPTTGIFNAVINAWARSKEKIAPSRAEQILKWMGQLQKTNPSIRPDKYTYNTVIHAYAKTGGVGAAKKAQELLDNMHTMYKNGNHLAKPDTITYNVVINSLAKSGGKDAAKEAEKLLVKMHKLYEEGDLYVKPNVVTYGAVIDAYAKSGERHAAARADTLLAKMIHLNQMDPVTNSDLQPNTYVFNTVINAHVKSKEHDAASKAEEMLLAMNRFHLQGLPNLKPDAFTYTAVIDAWAKSGYRGAAARADQLLDKMESKYLAGDMDLKPNTFTYNAVINALAKSGEPSAASRAERVLHNMVNRHRHGASDDVKPTTINFNSVLDAWAKSSGGRKAAERAEEILEWMDRLYKSGNYSVRPDTITFNAVLDAWARSGDRMAAHRAEQILDHMDELYRTGNQGVKPDTYTYNTLINAHAKSSEKGSAARAEHVLQVMKHRYLDGDKDFKPNTRTHTSVIDAWAKSGEKGAARRAEQILNSMIASFEETGDYDSKPNVHTANAVCNACAFTKRDEDRRDALQIAFRVYDWLSAQPKMEPDAYTYTILLSVCSNLLPREDRASRFSHSKSFFEKCCESGHVNDYVLRKLRQTVSEQEYLTLVDYQGAVTLPPSWTRKVGHKNTRFVNTGGDRNNTGGRSKNSGRSSWHKRRGSYNR